MAFLSDNGLNNVAVSCAPTLGKPIRFQPLARLMTVLLGGVPMTCIPERAALALTQ